MDARFCKDCGVEIFRDSVTPRRWPFYCPECKRKRVARKPSRLRHKDMRRTRILGWYSEVKDGLSCSICGESHPACLDFHHRIPEEKSFCVSKSASRGRSIEVLLAEIEKCAVLCSNCHRKIHSNIPL